MKGYLPYLLLNLLGGSFAGVAKLQRRWNWECPAGTCPFTLSVNGMPVYENPVDAHQLAYGGQGNYMPVEFCISSEGQITDNAGVCGITMDTGNDMETTQFQCDAGMMSTFTISCTGDLEYNGSPWFYACLASEVIGYNIYATAPTASQCASGTPAEIELVASSCVPDCQSGWSGWWSNWSGKSE